MKRAAALALSILACGCAAEGSPSAFLSPAHLGAGTELADDNDEADIAPLAPLPGPHLAAKPLSSRVLSAIAFERSTGREAHPSRILSSR